jgi:hypothetical protein
MVELMYALALHCSLAFELSADQELTVAETLAHLVADAIGRP